MWVTAWVSVTRRLLLGNLQSWSTCSLWRIIQNRSHPSSTRCHRVRASTNSATGSYRKYTASTTPSAAVTLCTSSSLLQRSHPNRGSWWASHTVHTHTLTHSLFLSQELAVIPSTHTHVTHFKSCTWAQTQMHLRINEPVLSCTSSAGGRSTQKLMKHMFEPKLDD